MIMADSNPTCFVNLEIPLTVTFNVVNDYDHSDWTDRYCDDGLYGNEFLSDDDRVVSDSTPVFTTMSESASDSEIKIRADGGHFDLTEMDRLLIDRSEDFACQVRIQRDVRDAEMGKRSSSSSSCCVANHGANQISFPNFFPMENGKTDERLCDTCVGRFSCSEHETGECGCRFRFWNKSVNHRSTSLISNGIPIMSNCSGENARRQIGNSDSGGRLTSDERIEDQCNSCPETSYPVCGDWDQSTQDVNANSSKIVYSAVGDDSRRNDRIQMDLGYFTEEGNEGNRDEESENDSAAAGDSISERLDATTESSENLCCDQIRELHDEVRGEASTFSKSGILRHSKTSASFDCHLETHLPMLHKENWTDYYHLLPGSSKSVAFLENTITIPNDSCDSGADNSGAMERLRTVTNQLRLCVNTDESWKEHRSNQTSDNVQRPAADDIDSSDTEDSDAQRMTTTYDNIDEFIANVKQQLFQIQESNETIASRLLTLYYEIRQFKYMRNCQLYREMMETAIDNEDKKDELSHHQIDTIPERLCTTFKQWGLTRNNLQRRRFSIY